MRLNVRISCCLCEETAKLLGGILSVVDQSLTIALSPGNSADSKVLPLTTKLLAESAAYLDETWSVPFQSSVISVQQGEELPHGKVFGISLRALSPGAAGLV
jgi:hypothetical protein